MRFPLLLIALEIVFDCRTANGHDVIGDSCTQLATDIQKESLQSSISQTGLFETIMFSKWVELHCCGQVSKIS